jgi:hypothetical protein
MAQLDQFEPGTVLGPPWNSYNPGGGRLEFTGHSVRLFTPPMTAAQYTDAQIDDYQQLPRHSFLWRPPLTLTVRARFSHPTGELRGTGGFGFWNDPFMMTGRRKPALPRAIWFFFSSTPSNMKLDINTPGPGWKAATLDAIRWPFFLLLPTAPVAVPLMNIDSLYRPLWPIGQRAIGVRETIVSADMQNWHTYTISWQAKSALFCVDGRPVLKADTAPRGPLGFVMWLDNQYMIVTPWGRFGYGLLDVPRSQWLEISRLEITPSAVGVTAFPGKVE